MWTEHKDYSEQLSKVKKVSFKHRVSICSLPSVVDIPKSTLFNIYKLGKKIKHIFLLFLTFANRSKQIRKIKFCLSFYHITIEGKNSIKVARATKNQSGLWLLSADHVLIRIENFLTEKLVYSPLFVKNRISNDF